MTRKKRPRDADKDGKAAKDAADTSDELKKNSTPKIGYDKTLSINTGSSNHRYLIILGLQDILLPNQEL
jgi:hypothetical protein